MTKIVLFIDDDESFLLLIEHACTRVDSIGTILKSSDGAEAKELIVRLLEEHQPLPHIIFVDINMPRLDGFGFLKAFQELRTLHPQLAAVKPIAMLTSSDQKRDRDRAKSLGADEYIVKPNTLLEIRHILSELTR